jgi:hypothetical protein
MEEKANPGDSEACEVVINNVERLYTSDVYQKVVVHHYDNKLQDSEWEELQQAVDAAFPGFSMKLYQKHSSLSQKEYRVCLLLKIGVKCTHISKIFCNGRGAITAIRRRLSKKMFGTPDTKLLDDFIQNI